jgi:transcriptional regulator with AAA-type ATPase domain
MGDAEVQYQRHRARLIREAASQLNIPTSLTPALSHLLRFHFVGCVKEVRNLINRPVVGTSAEMVPTRFDLKLPATASRER